MGRTGTTLSPPELVVFLDELEAAGRSAQTIEVYHYALSAFLRHISGRGTNNTQPLDIRDFLDQQRSVNTKAIRLIVLRKFFRFLQRRGLVSVDPTEGIPTPRMRRRNYPLLTEDEFRRVCECSPPTDRLLLLVLYRTGARIGETCFIRAEHLSLNGEGGIIEFPRRKGGEPGFAAFGSDLAQELSQRLQEAQNGWIFAHPHDPTRPLPASTAHMRVVRAGKRAGLASKLTPHRLRHGFISACVEAGWPQLALQQQVGHRSPQATAFYYHPSRKGLRALYKKMNQETS